jgi:hypothetical protein
MDIGGHFFSKLSIAVWMQYWALVLGLGLGFAWCCWLKYGIETQNFASLHHI